MTRWLCLFLLAAAMPLQAQVYRGKNTPFIGKTLVSAELIADTTAIVPGKPFEVGVILHTLPEWHTYWEYVGDSGGTTYFEWSLPGGFTVGPIEWPLPHRWPQAGGFEIYVYPGTTMLMATVTPPAQMEGESVTLKARAYWTVCIEECIPGQQEISLTLPVSSESAPANEEIFRKYRAELPAAGTPPYALEWKREGASLRLTVRGLEGVRKVEFFPLPLENQIVDHPQVSAITNGVATISITVQGDLKGLLVVDGPDGRNGWYVISQTAEAVSVIAHPQADKLTLWMALFYGFLGGLILNLMPCVLPVISLKIFGFIRQAGSHPERILRHGLAFVAGIFAWFMGLGLLVVGLKAAGQEVSWAFQFQNPWFNVVIICIVFVFALNLFGVFEIVLSGRAATALDREADGYWGSFAQGVFATLLATPCTAPFLGPALGFAFSQPSGVILVMFASVALGMASPYFLLSARPGWMKVLPKPGAWMERLKQFMGFPLLATMVWLLSVVGEQKGSGGMIWLAGFLVCLGLVCWIYGSFGGPLKSLRRRIGVGVLIVAILAAGGWYFLGERFAQATPPPAGKTVEGGIEWQPFSPQALADLRAEGKPVFLDFTAAWCISCKVNEKISINIPPVREAFSKYGIVPMKADWTNYDPGIRAVLESFGRVGVPLYVVYPAGRGSEPIILPEILTPQIVLDALEKARGN